MSDSERRHDRTHDDEDNHAAVDSEPDPVVYSGFWSRLLAKLVDIVVFAPLIALDWWSFTSRSLSIAFLIPLSAAGPLYNVVMHARRGQTVGKIVARIQVTKVSGHPVAWREALLRDSVDIALNVISTAATMFVFLHMPESAWHGGLRDLTMKIQESQPSWGRWAGIVGQVWMWSELLVLLLNRKRRSLHDFIAGTVVVKLAGRS